MPTAMNVYISNALIFDQFVTDRPQWQIKNRWCGRISTKNQKEKQCKNCKKLYDCSGGSTNGLRKHIIKVHNIVLASNSEQVPGPSASVVPSTSTDVSLVSSPPAAKKPKMSQPKITKFIEKVTMEEEVAVLMAVDGFSAHAIANSSFIRKHLAAKGDILPKHPRRVMDLMHSFFEKARNEIKNIFKGLKHRDEKFSTTLDEWTSQANRRYLNVNVHTSDGRTFNLGLERIVKSCPADEMRRLYINKLAEFELCENDIIGCTSDGAAVMVRFGSLIPSNHQQCMNHGIHLAVLDAIAMSSNHSD